ncbi:MAG: hypothetical protein OXR66_00615 [Candidatus Woesearchaeota archaeon]|nr:hypothetical protein [Candidatus Woesearchaeota archaeon]
MYPTETKGIGRYRRFDRSVGAAVIRILGEGQTPAFVETDSPVFLDREDGQRVRNSWIGAQRFGGAVTYVNISNPTLKRMRGAIAAADEVRDFFAAHDGEINAFAEAYKAAKKTVADAKPPFSFTAPTGLQKLTHACGKLMAGNTLMKAGGELSDIAHCFPKGLLTYAAPPDARR